MTSSPIQISGLKTRALLAALGLIVGTSILAPATPSQAQSTGQSRVQTKQANELELDQVRESIEQATARQKAFRAEIKALDKDVGAINRALIETAKRGQQLEAAVSAAEAALSDIVKTQSMIRSSLKLKRALLGEVLAALQRMGRKPPPAILVRPEDALASIRSAILLGAVVPEIRSETDTLFAELRELNETTRKVEQQKIALADRLNALAEDETRLTLLVEEKNELTKRSHENLIEEQSRAAELAAKATSLKDLIGSLETQIASATAAAAAARDADERRKKRENQRLLAAKQELEASNGASSGQTGKSSLQTDDPSRIEPAIAFSKAKGALYLPVSGVELYRFGSVLGGQSRSRNIALATRPNARVRAPSDSWVVYAGPFRSYGQLLILNAGDGYHIVLAGLSEVNVEAGRFVLAGEPIGRMGTTRVASAVPVELGSKRPVLTVEFRKDGKSIDPAPWWGPRPRTGTQKGSDNDS